MTFTIAPTSEDIRDGVPRDRGACPVALFLRRAWPGYRPDVGFYYIRLRDPENMIAVLTAAMPLDLCNWIDDFDAGKPVGPISVEVELR